MELNQPKSWYERRMEEGEVGAGTECLADLELFSIRKALKELIQPDTVETWLRTANESFGGKIPMKMIDVDDTDPIWEMIDLLRSGEPKN